MNHLKKITVGLKGPTIWCPAGQHQKGVGGRRISVQPVHGAKTWCEGSPYGAPSVTSFCVAKKKKKKSDNNYPGFYQYCRYLIICDSLPAKWGMPSPRPAPRGCGLCGWRRRGACAGRRWRTGTWELWSGPWWPGAWEMS